MATRGSMTYWLKDAREVFDYMRKPCPRDGPEPPWVPSLLKCLYTFVHRNIDREAGLNINIIRWFDITEQAGRHAPKHVNLSFPN